MCAALFVTVPGRPPIASFGVLLGVGSALIFPLHAATIIRGMRAAADKTEQWRALLTLPRSLLALLAGLGLGVVALLTLPGDDGSGLQAGDSVHDRYYAVDTTDPRRSRVEVTRSEYEALSKHDQRHMLTVYGALAAGGGALTLVFGALDFRIGRP
ncbi:hypothetical protein ACFY7C_04480 [Streptomyces sp. NPDC012769]|uniref:hypothetical protein n=1 Tax=Streptomyces sp. NPDC012769 TaxID=3364848 RepID=UPI0036913F3A